MQGLALQLELGLIIEVVGLKYIQRTRKIQLTPLVCL